MLLIAMVLSCTSLISQEKSVPVLDSGITTQAVIPAEPLSNDATIVQYLDKYSTKIIDAVKSLEQPAKIAFGKMTKLELVKRVLTTSILTVFLIIIGLFSSFMFKRGKKENAGKREYETDESYEICGWIGVAVCAILLIFSVLSICSLIQFLVFPEFYTIQAILQLA